MTAYEELSKVGRAPVPIESLTDETLPEALRMLVLDLFDLGVVIYDADHLADRELYNELYEFCHEPTYLVPENPDAHLNWSPIGACSEEDIEVWLRYYADDKEREAWSKEWGDPIPTAEVLPRCRWYMPQR